MSYKVKLNSCDVLPRIHFVESGPPIESDIFHCTMVAVMYKIEIIHTIYGMCSNSKKNEQE